VINGQPTIPDNHLYFLSLTTISSFCSNQARQLVIIKVMGQGLELDLTFIFMTGLILTVTVVQAFATLTKTQNTLPTRLPGRDFREIRKHRAFVVLR
jgi:hypothetical protein